MAAKREGAIVRRSRPPAKAAAREPGKLKVSIEPSLDMPAYYVNHFEVSYRPHDITILAARLPGKLSDSDRLTAVSSGQLKLEPDVQIVIAPSLLDELIRVLELQRDKWNAAFGKAKKEEDKA